MKKEVFLCLLLFGFLSVDSVQASDLPAVGLLNFVEEISNICFMNAGLQGLLSTDLHKYISYGTGIAKIYKDFAEEYKKKKTRSIFASGINKFLRENWKPNGSPYKGETQEDSQECIGFILENIFPYKTAEQEKRVEQSKYFTYDEVERTTSLDTTCEDQIDKVKSYFFLKVEPNEETLVKNLNNYIEPTEIKIDASNIINDLKKFGFPQNYENLFTEENLKSKDFFASKLSKLKEIKKTDFGSLKEKRIWKNYYQIHGRDKTDAPQNWTDLALKRYEAHDNRWVSKNCGKKVDAKREFIIGRLPRYLLIQLKRFKQDTSGAISKIETEVTFPFQNLDMNPYLTENSKSVYGENTRYDLIAIVMHGGSFSGGHYTAYGLRTDGWYYFNDARFSKINDMKKVVGLEDTKKKAYLLFYERKNWSQKTEQEERKKFEKQAKQKSRAKKSLDSLVKNLQENLEEKIRQLQEVIKKTSEALEKKVRDLGKKVD